MNPHKERVLIGETVHYECDKGYLAVGNASLTLMNGGVWNSALPHCEGKERIKLCQA